MKTLGLTLTMAVLLSCTAICQKSGEWAKGVQFHTDWKSAIEEARTTGKLIFIYNGWKKKGI